MMMPASTAAPVKNRRSGRVEYVAGGALLAPRRVPLGLLTVKYSFGAIQCGRKLQFSTKNAVAIRAVTTANTTDVVRRVVKI